MSKTIKMPNIAQWEETDSELAKYTIQKLSYEMNEAEELIKYLRDKINKAIEYIEENKQYIVDKEIYENKLLFILRGNNDKFNE